MELKETIWSAASATTMPAWERSMLMMKNMNEVAWKKMKDILV